MIFEEILKWFLLGAIGAVVLLKLAEIFFPKIGLLDFPERYGLVRGRIPYPGGAVFFLLSFGIFLIDESFFSLSLGLATLGIVSFLDDFLEIPAFLRLIFQLLVATFIFSAGVQILFIGDPLHDTNFDLKSLPAVSFLLTVFWILAIQNAMNFFDGLPGLSVGISGVGFLTLGILSVIRPELFFDPGHQPLLFANFFLGGMCVGGFWFFWKKRLILGDTGSQILGFLLAVMSIFSGAKIATTLLTLGLPILDVFFVSFRRIFIEKRSPFRGDLRHLHHNLARRVGATKTVIFLIFASGILGGVAIFSTGFSKMIALGVAIFAIFSLEFWAIKKNG